MRKTQHEMPPMVLVIKRNGARAGLKRLVGEFSYRHPGVEIEHAQICPSEQCMSMRVVWIESDRLPQTVLGQTLLLNAHTPHMRQGLHHPVPSLDVLWRLTLDARGFGYDDL